jgi:hypothetical protein
VNRDSTTAAGNPNYIDKKKNGAWHMERKKRKI